MSKQERQDAARALRQIAQRVASGELSIMDMHLSADMDQSAKDGFIVHEPTGILRLSALFQMVKK